MARRSIAKVTTAVRFSSQYKIALGWSIKNSAIATGISYKYAQSILQKSNQNGLEAVFNKKKNYKKTESKKALLNSSQLKKLSESLTKKPSDGGIWTGAKVARWIEKETGIKKVWHQRGWDYLKKLNYSWQRPRPKHRKGNPEAQAQFKENLPLKAQKMALEQPEVRVEIWFFDEQRVGLKPILRKVWSQKGERPIATVEHRYEWLYIYGFVEPQTGRTYWYLIPRVNIQWLNLVYETFAQDVGLSETKKIILVEDRAGWHRSQKVKVPLGIIREHLPPYSPELQPAERLWALVDATTW